LTQSTLTTVSAHLPSLKETSVKRLVLYLVQGNNVLSSTSASSNGTFQLHVAESLLHEHGVSVVLGPKGLDPGALLQRTDLPRLPLTSTTRSDQGGHTLNLAGLGINDELIDSWWIWCREYTISGTLETGGGCPVGAYVTIYNVTSGVSGLIPTAIVTVPTDPTGAFTASFNWCSRLCWWPCWPIWWECWPWWWELDILALIENVERQIETQSARPVRVQSFAAAPLRQPDPADLMTGVGFAATRAGVELQPDSARTALIASKFADPQIRELFPWWWWCCDNPNILFSAIQGTNTVLSEDPNTSTRWCFASGQTVSLTPNSQAVGACQPGTTGPCGFTWTSVGDEPGGVLFENISMGYAESWGSGGACSNLAFAGTLNLNGLFSGDCTAFYQVLAGQWGGDGSLVTAGNPARGGTPPAAFQQLSVPLVDTITIWSAGVLSQVQVALGPCSYAGQNNLYISRNYRQNPPVGVTGLSAFPTIGPGDVWGWDAPNLVLAVPAADLANQATGTGGVTLAIVPYDKTGAALPTATQSFVMGPDLTLMIDTTPLTSQTILPPVTVYNSDGSAAMPTAASSENCPAYVITKPPGYALVSVNVTDNAGHLCEYLIQTQYGFDTYATATPSDRDYAQPPSTFTPPSATQPYGVGPGYLAPNNLPAPPPAPQVPAASNWTFVGGTDTIQIAIPETCCYDFQLFAGKRTTDGQTFGCFPLSNPSFQTVNITVESSGSSGS
jgi:hypothetical protein